MKCVFCNTDYPVGTIVCSICNEYKGLITPEEERTLGMTTLGSALDDAFDLMEEAREHHLETHPSDCDCDYRAGEE
jgi:hypothetical protein